MHRLPSAKVQRHGTATIDHGRHRSNSIPSQVESVHCGNSPRMDIPGSGYRLFSRGWLWRWLGTLLACSRWGRFMNHDGSWRDFRGFRIGQFGGPWGC